MHTRTRIFPASPENYAQTSSAHSAFCSRQHPSPARRRRKSLLRPVATLKVTSEVVNVYAVVRQKNGRLIPDLNKEDFTVEEDQQPQVIRYFAVKPTRR